MMPTEKQMELIRSLEQSLGIKFEGSTKQEAWLWTQANMPPKDEGNAITDKQRVAISNVEQVLNISFDGETKDAARSWLSINMPLAVQNIYDDAMAASSNQTFAGAARVHHWKSTPDAYKLRYLELIDSFTEFPDMQELNLQIGILNMGTEIF